MQKIAYGVCITTKENLFEELPWDLHDLGAAAVETRDSTTMTRSDAADTVVYIAGFDVEAERNDAARKLQEKYPELEMTRLEIRDDGWSEGWKKFFQPVVLDKVQVITPWMTPPMENRKTIVIDPGQAFGTGGHATTRLILQFVEAQANQGFPEKILDVGTGSGVLAIACALLGAPQIVGFDVEAPAIEAARENLERNGVAERVSVLVASLDELNETQLAGPWPLVLANIQLAVFLQYADAISRLVSPGGIILISGILEEQRDQCLALWPDFTLHTVLQEGEWLAMKLEKKLEKNK